MLANRYNLPESLATIIKPQLGAGAVLNGINISLKNVHRALIIAQVNQGNAALETVALAQSTGNAGSAGGTGETTLSGNVPIYTLQDAELANTGWTRQADGTSFQFSATQPAVKYAIFVVEPELCMNIAGGFDCIVANFTSNVNAATVVGVIALLEPRYSPVPTVYSD